MTPRAYAWAAAIVVLGLLLACGSRYITRPTRIGGVVSAPECDEARMLAAMRQWLRPEVDFSESTGIYLDATDPADEEARVAYAALARICPPPAGRRADDAGAFAEQLARIASGFIMEGTLEPGRYVLVGTAGGPGGDAVVAVTSEHLALLRSMNTRPYGRAVMLMDSKRPYGDMSYFYIDLARALGEPVPLDAGGHAAFAPEVTARYDQLHEQMIGVVRVFWRFAQPAPSSS